jgi:hypothetical protein
MDCTFSHLATGKIYVVPGHFANEGNAANTERTSGTVWTCHFTPDETGLWDWSVDLAQGTNVAQNGGGNLEQYFSGSSGSFEVKPSDKTGPDLRSKGRLSSNGKFAEGQHFLKVGSDALEDILKCDEFDGPPKLSDRKSCPDHEADYNFGDPTWREGKGKKVIGAINYLANQGVNVLTVCPLKAESGKLTTFPFVTDDNDDHLHYDNSKLAQWEILFDWAEKVGMAVDIKLHCGGADDLLGFEELRLYYREMLSRFGHHLGVSWDLTAGHTHDLKKLTEYFREVNPYESPTVANELADRTRRLVYTAYNKDRQELVWSNVMNGGHSIQHNVGPADDLRTLDGLWEQSRFLLDFFEKFNVPFGHMSHSASLSPGNKCLVDANHHTIVVYKKASRPPTIDLPALSKGNYKVQWYDPREGGDLQGGTVKLVRAGKRRSLGKAPYGQDEDWVLLLECVDNCQ